MATAEYKFTIGAPGAASANLIGAVVSGQVAAKSDGTHGAAFTSALATLVADGASPTQAHVTAVNSAWTTYKADIDAQTTAIAAVIADVSLYIGTVANVADMNKLRSALRAFEKVIAGSDVLASGSATPGPI